MPSDSVTIAKAICVELPNIKPIRDDYGTGANHAVWMLGQISKGEMPGDKSNRWLGYAQAILVDQGLFSLEDFRKLNRRKS
ncbi:MAG: hypothetical protein GY847_14470 [Proteobacteria bacterium]|nr:hypothetical protein [Pseudomonadota bacterium]